uniref:C-type lectin domain-containing protein n=1 Tax=Plectus sambesii TaxID=2011161 RepID=A0A914WMR9_9BILA
MLFSLAILLFISPTVAALTDLQTKCTGPDRRYNGTSCYVMVKNARRQNFAKLSCNHYLGYSGHLFHIKNAAAQATAKELISNYSSADDKVYTGLEPINSSAPFTDQNNWGHYYRDGTFVSATNLPWAPSQPTTNTAYNRVYYQPSSDKIYTLAETTTYFCICEFEEALKQPVTDLEQKCSNFKTGPNTFTSFVNDVCYVIQIGVTKNYNDAKVSCNAFSGYYGRLAHIRTMSDLWIADTIRSAARVPYARLGMEQTDLSSTNASIGWYLTTPTNQSMPATFLPWAASNPVVAKRSIAVTTGYPKIFATVDSATAYPSICQYGRTTLSATTGEPGKSRSYL